MEGGFLNMIPGQVRANDTQVEDIIEDVNARARDVSIVSQAFEAQKRAVKNSLKPVSSPSRGRSPDSRTNSLETVQVQKATSLVSSVSSGPSVDTVVKQQSLVSIRQEEPNIKSRTAANPYSREQLAAKFKEERETVIEQLRRLIDALFERQEEWLMQIRSDTDHEPAAVYAKPPVPQQRPQVVPMPKSEPRRLEDEPGQRISSARQAAKLDNAPETPEGNNRVSFAREAPDTQKPRLESPPETPQGLSRVSFQNDDNESNVESLKPEERISGLSVVSAECSAVSTELGSLAPISATKLSKTSETEKERTVSVSVSIPDEPPTYHKRNSSDEREEGDPGPDHVEGRGHHLKFSSVRTKRFSETEKAKRKMTVANGTADLQAILKLREDRQQEDAIRKFIKSNVFETSAAVLLFTNIALLGVQVEIQANSRDPDDLPIFKILNMVYCIAFVSELGMRIFAHKAAYFIGEDWPWGWFDLVVVSMQVVEILIAFSTSFDTGTMLNFFGRLVRIARVARVVRAIRIMRFLRGFKVLCDAIYGTLQSCIWALLLLMIIIYVFSLIFAQFASDFLSKQEESINSHPQLDFYFGNFTSAMFTLFKSIVGGIDWEICASELTKVGTLFTFLFIMYIILMQFVVINVIAGLFLQSAIEQAQSDQEHIIQLRLKEKANYVKKLTQLFGSLDSSRDGNISLPEFEAHLKDNKVQAFFAGLEIENADAWTIFKLLDTDGGGSVDYAEFVEGCIRLRGNASSIEIAQLMYHHKWMMDKVCEVADFLYNALDPESAESAKGITPRSSWRSDNKERLSVTSFTEMGVLRKSLM